MKRNRIALFAIASLAISTFVIHPAAAQDKMGGKMDGGKMSGGKMAAGKMDMKSVYVCKTCKVYYTSSLAKKMAYKDPMGHKLVKMDKAPAGFKDGSKMKMDKGGKMGGKMEGGKMEGGKM
ncbi:MAG: hypothetical protein JWL77_3943 [Chthonomonadaceae bacterium]|nr:hypothetical protein [Chthonomonadaceae bacterium]